MTRALDISFGTCVENPIQPPRPELTIADLRATVDRSMSIGRTAFVQSRAFPLAHRLRAIRKFRESVAARAAHLAQQLANEAHRNPEELLASEIIPLLDACCYLEKNAARVLRTGKYSVWSAPLWLFGTRHQIVREPLGLVLIIGASNYPLFLPGVQVLQALVAGNAVLLKPAPTAINTAQTLRHLLVASGISEDLLQILPAAPEAATYAISRKVDKVFLTGSAETGRKVLIHAATAITPAVVELSGCDAAFILPDADLDLAAQCLAFGLTLNSGHTCIAPRRAFVWQEVSAALIEKLQQALSSYPKTFTRTCPGSETIANLFEATAEGAYLVNGALCKNGIIEGPIVLANVDSESAFAMSENWGPNLSIISVANEAEALEASDLSQFGLGASIFTRSDKDAQRLARSVCAGSVCINDIIVPTADGRLPFSGRKQSGFGATRGREGLLEMTASKVISTRSFKSHFHLRSPADNQLDMLSAYTAAAYASGRARFSSVRKLFRSLVHRPRSTIKQKERSL
jgi:acyl-CoA reductase-like NAD-dependent aldehyde dehydrogenase